MTEPSGPGHVILFWPAWTRTIDAMVRSLARARSRCRRCGTLLHVDLDTLRGKLGRSASLIDRTSPCPVVGCTGTIYYLGSPATGAAYHVLIGDPRPARRRRRSGPPAVPIALARHDDDRRRAGPDLRRSHPLARCRTTRSIAVKRMPPDPRPLRTGLLVLLDELERGLATLRRRTLIVGLSAFAVVAVRLIMILAARP